MKYNNNLHSSSSLPKEEKKSTLTIYADMDINNKKVNPSGNEMGTGKDELQRVQKALLQQTRRCRQLVEEYTKILQQKEDQYQCEKSLRDDQLARVLKALLIFEARLKQEQKYISHQLKEKDYIISKQSNDIKKLLANQYCKNCNRYFSNACSPNLESMDSSSEYVITDYQDSNFGSLDSSSDIYATVSEKYYNTAKDNSNNSSEESQKVESESKGIYIKNSGKDSVGKRKKVPHRTSVGTYFEVLKLRNTSPYSNEDNTSNDYDNFDSLTSETLSDKMTGMSQVEDGVDIQNLDGLQEEGDYEKDDLANESELTSTVSLSESNITVIHNNLEENKLSLPPNHITSKNVVCEILDNDNLGDEKIKPLSQITHMIPVFEGGDETNENWYASASDQEDEQQRDIYRNNPVLECVNQILIQNMNDALNSPPKSPNLERKSIKNKKVKFSDEEVQNTDTANILTKENVKEKCEIKSQGYYETPIQKTPNFYEVPQSIYSNDYEQILSRCNETFSSSSSTEVKDDTVLSTFKNSENKNNHHYIDMDDTKPEVADRENVIRKAKIVRPPPALPPKPANLVSKYKIQGLPKTMACEKNVDSASIESEPDYCSISELNLPPLKNVSFKKINVVAEINTPSIHETNKVEKLSPSKSLDDLNLVGKEAPELLVNKCVEKINIQEAKQTPIIVSEKVFSNLLSPIKSDTEIPKLPQVSEIIIPEEKEEIDQDARISQDNYVKNNSQILQTTSKNNQTKRRSIVMGSTVSSLITGFNNRDVISELNTKTDKRNVYKRMFSSFENLQNIDKQFSPKKETKEIATFDKFDLSQNFEEFKLDDCEIEEYSVEENNDQPNSEKNSYQNKEPITSKEEISTRVGMVRAKNDVLVPNLNRNSIEMLKKQLELQKNQVPSEQVLKENSFLKQESEPTYEHFLECTGLSTKSILSTARVSSSHKNVLKPKDVKIRYKTKSSNTIKYWSEPYL